MLTITIISIKMNESGISNTLYVKQISKLLKITGVSPDSKESDSNIGLKECVIV